MRNKFFESVLIAITGLAFTLIFTYPAMLLWNWLVPYIFSLPELTFWQMFCLIILIRFLTPSFNDKNL